MTDSTESGAVKAASKVKQPLYLALASLLQRKRTLEASGNNPSMLGHVEWTIGLLCKHYLPSGSGFDSGTTLDEEQCWPARDPDPFPKRLTFMTEFHHMNDVGYYTEWTRHTVTVKPHWFGFTVRVTGPNRNGIKDYIADVFDLSLKQEVEYAPVPPRAES